MSLLSETGNKNNHCLSEKIVDRMKKEFSHSTDSLTSASILSANIYASAGQMDKSLTIRNHLNQSGQKKEIGLVWTEKDGEIFVIQNLVYSLLINEKGFFATRSNFVPMIDLIFNHQKSIVNYINYHKVFM